MKEIWKDMVNYEGRYQISNFGKIRSLVSNGKKVRETPLELKTSLSHKGYKVTCIVFHRKYKTVSIHRQVALHFIPNPLNLSQVNHIDGNKLNNHYTNLEWMSGTSNMRHAFENNLFRRGGNKVLMYKVSGEFVGEFIILRDITRKYGVETTNINKVLKGKYSHSNGYIFKYKDK